MAIQSSYSERQPAFVAGFQVNMRPDDVITRSVETSAGIPFGVAVSRGTDTARGAKIGGALADFLGVSVRDVTLVPLAGGGTTVDTYPQYAGMAIHTRGEIIVQVTGTPVPGDPVHFNASTGVFASSGGSGPILGAEWMETSANGLGRLYLSGYSQ